jgi:hypothetical protein
MISSSGYNLPIQGRIALQVKIDHVDFPCLYFWVTPRDYGHFYGIIGTDISAGLDITINCKEGRIILNQLEAPDKEIHYNVCPAPEAVHNLKHYITPRPRRSK